jgi:phosphoketolase
MASCGDVPTKESLAAVAILREEFPKLKIRFVNVVDLMKLMPSTDTRTDLKTASSIRFSQKTGMLSSISTDTRGLYTSSRINGRIREDTRKGV